MLQLILGRAGTGKTEWVWSEIRARAVAGRRSLLLVPEQFASTADLTGYVQLGDELHGLLKVCSFRTLTQLVEQRCGGGALHTISDAGRLVLVRRVLANLGENIVYFSRPRKSARFCADCAEALAQLKYCGVGPELLDAAAAECGGGRGQRLHELGVILAAYEEARKKTGLEPVDRITRAAERVDDGFFEGLAFFVDGFGEFTAPEMKLLGRMLAAAEQVCVTLCCPDADFEGQRFTVFGPAADTAVYLRRMAARLGAAEAGPLVLTKNRRFRREGLVNAERLAAHAAPVSASAEGLFCRAADGVYDEALAAAADIAALVRAGVPCGQIVVVCRDPKVYLPALQHSFALYGLPLFTGSTVSAEYAPMAVFLRAALALAKNGLTGDGVLALLKTGLTGADEAALSALENYAYTWRPKADDWRAPFTQNPAGMDAGEPGPEEQALLEQANALRARIVPAVERYRAARGGTGREISAALYRLLLDVGADRVTEKWIEAERGQGLGGFDSARMWETVIGFLDEMAELLGDEPITPAEYDDLLCVLMRAAEIGQAPHTQNEIQLAAADRMRLDNPSHVFVLGLNEGSFPAPVGDSPLLTNDDRARLARLGAPLSGDFESMVLREEMHLYRALTSARDGVHLSWLAKKNGAALVPCSPVQRLCDALHLSPAEPDWAALALTPEAGFELLARHYREENPRTAALRAALAAEPGMAPRLAALERAAQNADFAVADTGVLRAVLGGTMSLSPSRVESYFECPFCYFLRYVLNIQPRPRAELGIPQSGTLIHWLLETLLRDFPALAGLDDDALDAEVRRRIESYVQEKLPGQTGRRFAYLTQRLGDSTVQLLRYIRDEQAQGRFVPCAFEQDIGHAGGVPAIELCGGRGERVRIVGTVDRVDVMTDDAGRRWLRVVDYKTGSKTFSLDDVCCGLNTQMLLYLFTLTRNGEAFFGKTQPAGVLYLLSDPAPSSDAKKSAFSVDGLVLDDDAVLTAMDRGQLGMYLPFKPGADGVIKSDKAASLELLGRLSHKLEELVLQMADGLYDGHISARPLKHGGYLRCKSCDYRPVCRHRDGENEAEVPKDSWRGALGFEAEPAGRGSKKKGGETVG